jgi:DNA-binding NarL/FixJ family response regulator
MPRAVASSARRGESVHIHAHAVLEQIHDSDDFVVVANGGQRGIEAFHAAQERGERFAVVITDLGMPHVDGRTVAVAVKSAAPDVAVILLTGWGHRLLAENDIPPCIDRVLSKPPKLAALRLALAELGVSTLAHPT